MSQFKYYESDYEQAIFEFLSEAGWLYKCGYEIHRAKDEVVYRPDFEQYLNNHYGDFSPDEVDTLISYITSVSNQSLYRSQKETYKLLNKGYSLTRDDGTTEFIEFFDFTSLTKSKDTTNVYRAINQFEFEQYHLCRPDIVLFVNGIPLSLFELKNPGDEKPTIWDAYNQTVGYHKDKTADLKDYYTDIPALMQFDFINVISDGSNTKYGSIFSDYEFYFKWKSTNGEDYDNSDGPASINKLIEGLFNPQTFLNVFQNYIFIPDNSKDTVILPKYYQYYGAEKMYSNILSEYKKGSGKGGTYWGATGCGKSYTMLFLSKRITTSSVLNKPTIILLTDRNDLDEQLSGDFENAKNYLIDENAISIPNREKLKEKLLNIQSGGIYLLTIQKFAEDVGLLSARKNIICISDEAHRTQTNTQAKYIRVDTTSDVKKTYGFAKYLRDSFPNATYVGFTGTPVDATLRVFGEVVVKYTMKMSLDDGATVGISRINGPREVQLDAKLAKACDEYYKAVEKAGANKEQIEQSKKDMTKLKVILGNDDRLNVVVDHFIWHYEKRLEECATVNGKAMFVCYDREIAYSVYKKIKDRRPEWFVKKRIAPEYDGDTSERRDALEIEKIKLVCSNSKRDSDSFKELIGTDEQIKQYAKEFKDIKSNFKIVILVDMWITGFDVPSLDTMYLDKPVEAHNLIQTISRVNRVFKGKTEGLIVDYIGLENSILEAMKLYGGDLTPVNGIETALAVFKDFMAKTIALMKDFDYSAFFNPDITAGQRYKIIQEGSEFVMADNKRKDTFMGYTKRIKTSYDLCIGHEQIEEHEVEIMNYFICVCSVIFKMTIGDTPDAAMMNRKVSELVDKAISSIYSNKVFNFAAQEEDAQSIFGNEFLEQLKKIPFPHTKYQALVKLLKKAIAAFGKKNKLKAHEFSQMLANVIAKYNARNEIKKSDEVIDDVINQLSEELSDIFKALKKEVKSFEDLNITYDEKAFYDILVAVAEKYKFKEMIIESEGEDVFVRLAKDIKELVGNKSKYTDWTNRQDVKDELYADVAKLLRKNGYPPKVIDEAYDEIMTQVENFKKYN